MATETRAEGSGTASGGDAANDVFAMRDLRAREIIKNHMLGAMGLGLIPFPALDAVAIAGAQVKMLRDLAHEYQIEFQSEQLGYSVVGSALMGLGLPLALSPAVFSMFKLVPGLGTVAGVASLPIVAGASKYALGKIFVQHFESGGTLLTFNARRLRMSMREHYQEGLRSAREMGASHETKPRPAQPPVASAPAAASAPVAASAPAAAAPTAAPRT